MSEFAPRRIGLPKGSEYQRLPRAALRTLIVCAGYYLGGIVALVLPFPPLGISIIWPPNAILLASLLLTPVPTWGWYLLAVLPTHFHLVTHFQPGVPAVTMLCQFTGNAVQAVIGALAVRCFIGAPPRLDTLRSMSVFILLAAIAAPALASVLATSLFILTGWASSFWLTWRLRVFTNVVPALTIAPLILVTVAGGTGALRKTSLRRYAEAGLLAAGLFAIGIPVFGMEAAGPNSSPALIYAPLPLLLWAAVRFGLGGVCLSILVVALLSLSNAFAGRGPFLKQSPAENVLSMQFFLTVISFPLLLLAALIEERRVAEEALRASYKQIQELAGRLITAQEVERRRIARELHDDVNQQLAALSIGLSSLKRRLPPQADAAEREVAQLQQQTAALVEEIRHLSHELHPGVLQHVGLVAALKGSCAEFGSLHKIEVAFHADDDLEEIPADIALCLYRVAQEALHNISRHAGAHRVEVSLTRRHDILELRIADDGRGFDLAEARRREGLGLISIDERIRLVAGRVQIESVPGCGTELRALVPLDG